MRPAIAVLGVGLAGSLALNLYFATRAPPRASDRSAAHGPKDGTARPADPARGAGGLDAKTQKLTPRPKLIGVPLGGGLGGGPDGEESSADAGDGRSIACRLAEKHATQKWLEQQAQLTEILKVALVDEKAHEDEVRKVVDHFAEELGLREDEKEDLRGRYDDLRKQTARDAVGALEEDPPDYDGFLREAQSMFAEEDRLFTEMFGDEAADWARQTAAERRAGILVIAASWAGVGWEEALNPAGAAPPE